MGFRPSKAVEGGGASFTGTIVSIKTGPFTYQSGQAGIGILIQNFDEDAGQERKYPDNYSAGKPSTVQPNAAGTGFEFASPDKKDDNFELVKGSLAYRFMEAVGKAGFPEDKMNVNGNENDISFLNLARFDYALATVKNFNDTESKIMLPVKFLGFAEKAPTAGAAKEAPAQQSAAAAVSADSLKEVVAGLVLAVVAEAGGSLPRTKLNTPVLQQITDAKQKGAAAQLLVRPDFLKSIEGITFDGTTLKVS